MVHDHKKTGQLCRIDEKDLQLLLIIAIIHTDLEQFCFNNGKYLSKANV